MSSIFKLIIYAACSLASLSIFPMIDIEQDVSLVVVAVPIISVLFRFGKTWHVKHDVGRECSGRFARWGLCPGGVLAFICFAHITECILR